MQGANINNSNLWEQETTEWAEPTTVADLVFRDDLTGLYNRRYLREFMTRRVRWDHESPPPLSVLMMDVDNFKGINDSRGHLVGDHVLVHVAGVLRNSFRGTDLVIRYAGDEFIVILPETIKDVAHSLAKRTLQQLMSAKYVHGDSSAKVSLSMSIGVATFPDDARNPDELVQKADMALYDSKRTGRGRITLASAKQPRMLAAPERLQNFPCPSLIGRDKILHTLRKYLPGHTPLSAPLIVIEGERGIGKTRLLTELVGLTQKSGVVWLWHRCSEDRERAPYSTLKALLGQLMTQIPSLITAALREMNPTEARYVARHIPGLQQDGSWGGATRACDVGEHREMMLNGFVDLLSRLSMSVPLGLCIDEFQHVDTGTLAVLLISRRKVNARMAIFCAVAAPSLDDSCLRGTTLAEFRQHLSAQEKQFFMEIPLPGLDREGVPQMVSSIFPGRKVRTEFDDMLYQFCRGNPLYLEAILRDMLGRDLARYTEGEWRLEFPAENDRPGSLDEAIRAHLDALDAETAQVLAHAAVIGPTFELDLLKRITGANTGYALGRLDKAKQAGILTPMPGPQDERFSFGHPTIRELIYQGLDPEQRKHIHRKVAEVHDDRSEEGAAVLAFHSARAGDTQQAGELCDRAQKYAGRVFDVALALGILRGNIAGRKEEQALSPTALGHLASALRQCLEAVECVSPSPEAAIAQHLLSIYVEFQYAFLEVDTLRICRAKGHPLVNGKSVDPDVLGKQTTRFLGLLLTHDRETLVVSHSVQEYEIEALLKVLQDRANIFDKNSWEAWRTKNSITSMHIDYGVDASQPPLLHVQPEKPTQPGPQDSEREDAMTQLPDAAPKPEREPPEQPKETGVPPESVPGLQLAPHPEAQLSRNDMDDTERLLSAAAVSSLKESVRKHTLADNAEALSPPMAIIQGRLASPQLKVRSQASKILADFLDLASKHRSGTLLESAAMAIQSRLEVETDPALLAQLTECTRRTVGLAVKTGNLNLAKRLIWGLRAGRPAKLLGRIYMQLALEKLSSDQTLDALINDLDSPDAEYREAARNVISSFGAQAVPRLLAALRTFPGLRIRRDIAELLAQTKSFHARDALAAIGSDPTEDACQKVMSVFPVLSENMEKDIRFALDHSYPRIRVQAVRLLGNLEEKWAREMLLDLATSSDTLIACEALRAIGSMADANVADRLRSLLRSLTNEAVRRECHDAIEKQLRVAKRDTSAAANRTPVRKRRAGKAAPSQSAAQRDDEGAAPSPSRKDAADRHTSPTERRKHQRVEAKQLVQVVQENAETGDRLESMGVTLDISEDGVQFEGRGILDAVQQVSICFALGNDLIESKGRVAHIRRTNREKVVAGIQFLGLHEEDRQRLGCYCGSMSA